MTTFDAASMVELDQYIGEEIQQGNLLAAQYALAVDGQVAQFQSFGAATDTSRFVIFSATKTIVAMALLPLLESGAIDLAAPVARYIPEFAANGKDRVTMLQLLTMQGGFPTAQMSPRCWGTSAGRRSQFADWTLDYSAGTGTEYHPMAAHWVIAELLETFGSRPYADIVHDLVVAPAGVGRILGSPNEPPITVRTLGQPNVDQRALLEYFESSDLVPLVTVAPDGLLSLNNPLAQAAAIPAGGGIATAADVALIYQSFIHNSAAALPSAWLRDATSTIRNGSINRSDGAPANRTIAGIVGGTDRFAKHRWFPATQQAFGHPGAGGQLCWLDHQSGISFSFLHDTLHADSIVENRRCCRVNELAMACVRGSVPVV